jgi:hypothetical protein
MKPGKFRLRTDSPTQHDAGPELQMTIKAGPLDADHLGADLAEQRGAGRRREFGRAAGCDRFLSDIKGDSAPGELLTITTWSSCLTPISRK